MKPPRLLHVFSTLAVGGPQRRFAQIANTLKGKYEHLLVAMDSNYAATALLEADVLWEKLDVMAGRHKTLANVPFFRRALNAQQPDALVTYNFGATEWGLANRLLPICRHIHIEDGFGPEEAQRQLPRRVAFRRIALTGPQTTIVVPSEGLHRIALGIWRLPPSKVRLIPNGIDVARFAPGQRSMQPNENSPTVVGTVCALRAEKNIGRLLAAFAEAGRQRALKLLIVGDGAERANLEAEARVHGIADRTEFTGATDRPEYQLARMDVFCLSSDTEQMPLGVLEAMAAGLPVASVDVGDVAQMLSPENLPFVVPAGDTAGLARVLGELCDDKSKAVSVGHQNRSRVQATYTLSKMVEAYDRLFSGMND